METGMLTFIIEYSTGKDDPPIERLHVHVVDLNAAEAEARAKTAEITAKSSGSKPVGHRIFDGYGGVVRPWSVDN